MNITLHQATEQVRELLEQLDPETGELPAEYEAARELVATKATAVAAYVLELERNVKSIKEYVAEVQAKAKSAERRAEWLRTYLREHMAEAGITKITDERGIFSATLSVGRDKSVEVFDSAQLPKDYLREIPASYVLDKVLIRDALEDGFDVPGARIVARDRLTIK